MGMTEPQLLLKAHRSRESVEHQPTQVVGTHCQQQDAGHSYWPLSTILRRGFAGLYRVPSQYLYKAQVAATMAEWPNAPQHSLMSFDSR